MNIPTTSPSAVELIAQDPKTVSAVNKPYFKEGKREEAETECNRKLIGHFESETKTNRPYQGPIPMSEIAKYGVGIYFHFYVINYFSLVFGVLGLLAGGAGYICYKDQGFDASQIRLFVEQFTFGNIPALGDTGKTNFQIFQYYDLGVIVLFMAALIFLRFWIPHQEKNLPRPYPRLEDYSLAIPSDYLPQSMSSAQFADLFLNKANIIKTALSRDFSPLLQALTSYSEAERETRQMQIDLSEGPHVAKKQPTLMYKPSQADLEVLRQNLENETKRVATMKSQQPHVEDYPATVGVITFATIKSKHRFLKAYLDGIKSGQLPDLYKLNGRQLSFVSPGSPADTDHLHPPSNSCMEGVPLHLILFGLAISLTAPILAASYGYKVDSLPSCETSTSSVFCACAVEGLISSFSKDECKDYTQQTMAYLGVLSGAVLTVVTGFGLAADAIARKMAARRNRVQVEQIKRQALAWTSVTCMVCFIFCIRAVADGQGLDGVTQAASDWAWADGSGGVQGVFERIGWPRTGYFQILNPLILGLALQAVVPIVFSSLLRRRSFRKGVSEGEEKPHTQKYWRDLFLGTPYEFGETQAKVDYFIFFGIALSGSPLALVTTSLFFGTLQFFAIRVFSDPKQVPASPCTSLSKGSIWWGYAAILVRIFISLISFSDSWTSAISSSVIGSNVSIVIEKWSPLIIHQSLLALWVLLGLAEFTWFLISKCIPSKQKFEEEQLEWCEKHGEEDEVKDNIPAHFDKLKCLDLDTYSIFQNPKWAVYLKPHFQDSYPDEEPDKQLINIPGQKVGDREKTEANADKERMGSDKNVKKNAILPYKQMRAKDNGLGQPENNSQMGKESQEPGGFTGFVKKVEVVNPDRNMNAERNAANNQRNLGSNPPYMKQEGGNPYQKGLNSAQNSNNTIPNQQNGRNLPNIRQAPSPFPGANSQMQNQFDPNRQMGQPGPRRLVPQGQNDPRNQGMGYQQGNNQNNRMPNQGNPFSRNHQLSSNRGDRQDGYTPSNNQSSRNPLIQRSQNNQQLRSENELPKEFPLYHGDADQQRLQGNTSQRTGRAGRGIDGSLTPSKPFFASDFKDPSGPLPPGYRSIKELGLFKPYENRLYGVSMKVASALEPEDTPAFLPGPNEDSDFDAALNFRKAIQPLKQ